MDEEPEIKPPAEKEAEDTEPEDEIKTAEDNKQESSQEPVPEIARSTTATATEETVSEPLTNGDARPGHGEKEGGNDDAAARFDALVKDRDALRLEVTQLRQSLEELRSKHATEIETIQGELAETQAEKESAEEQYQSLLGKVNTIRSQLGERLKADAVRDVS